MKCHFEFLPDIQDARGWRKLKCVHCGQPTPWTPHGPEKIFTHFECPGRPPGDGPGTVLRGLLRQLRIKPSSGCNCEAMIRKMDHWDQACLDHLHEITDHLRAAYSELSTLDKLKALWATVSTGLALELDWSDPIPSLVRLTVERSRRA